MRATAYHTQIPLPLFPFRIDWIRQAGFGLQAGTTSGIAAALIRPLETRNRDCLLRLIGLANLISPTGIMGTGIASELHSLNTPEP